jgi:hypothetical protein
VSGAKERRPENMHELRSTESDAAEAGQRRRGRACRRLKMHTKELMEVGGDVRPSRAASGGDGLQTSAEAQSAASVGEADAPWTDHRPTEGIFE